MRNRVTSAASLRMKGAMTPTASPSEPSLTSLSHGGGCGCKLSPAVLREVLARAPQGAGFANLMVGRDTSDDAAVWRLNDQQALVATTDFFMPVVDDPHVFGRIAATNALSDIYAMGGTPILALALVGMPISVLSPDTIGRILAGGESVCAEAGVPVAGGHSIDSVEPIYGLVAVGLCRPNRVLTNRTGRPGDLLILTKALGVGILSAAFKQERLDAGGYDALIASTTQLNSVGPELAALDSVHAMTDVTGFGLLGHALEMARGAGLTAAIFADGPAVLPGVDTLARGGVRTGAGGRNWASYGASARGADALPDWRRDILCDPQTSGGLLVAVDPAEGASILDLLAARGFAHAAVVGRLESGPAQIELITT